jgi:uncharacterized membrane protein YozB (DUF420 family)
VSSSLPALNATLNAAAGVCLCAGLVCIKRGLRTAHARWMLLATGISAAFLTSYLWYHFKVVPEIRAHALPGAGSLAPDLLRDVDQPRAAGRRERPLVAMTLRHAARKDWPRHRKLARITWPVWFYVSVTGVLVYLALYRWNPAAAGLPQ